MVVTIEAAQQRSRMGRIDRPTFYVPKEVNQQPTSQPWSFQFQTMTFKNSNGPTIGYQNYAYGLGVQQQTLNGPLYNFDKQSMPYNYYANVPITYV